MLTRDSLNDVVRRLAVGAGGSPPGLMVVDQPGDVIFRVGGEETLRLCGDGTILVRGVEVMSDEALVEAFRAYLRAAGYYVEIGGQVVVAPAGGRNTELHVKEARNP